MKGIILLFSFFILGCNATRETDVLTEHSGKVIKIVDGDTYDILLKDNISKRIRMDGIDAPERGMPFYKVSKDYLGDLCFGEIVQIKQTSTDRYGRTIAKTYLANGSEVGLLMITAGVAWHYKQYSTDAQLANAEIEARKNRIGLWVDEAPVAPWAWRKNKKQKIPASNIKTVDAF